MKKSSFHVLRLGLGITFLWIGFLVFRSPEAWGSFLQPWAVALLPVPLREMMIGTAYLDVAIGVLLVLNLWTWVAALVGAWHIAVVLITVGVNDVTVRDIGLLAATTTLTLETIPDWIVHKIFFWR